MKLAQIRESFQDNIFALMYYNSEAKDSLITAHIIHPKEVKIKEDLTVWDAKKGTCIINGMQDKDHFIVASSIKELEDKVKKDYPNDILKLKVKKKKL